MIEAGYSANRAETFGETYSRLKELKLWKDYRMEQKKLMSDGVAAPVIEETLWSKYSPNALVNRAMEAKQQKEEGVASDGVTQEDLHYVFTNIDQPGQSRFTAAPSAGAHSLLQRAKSDIKIYQWVLDHITPKTFADTGGTTWEADPARKLTGIGRQLRESFNDRRVKLLNAEGAGSED